MKKSWEFSKNKSLSCPRFLLLGNEGQAHISHIGPAILHAFDHLPVVVFDLTTINEDSKRNSDSCSFVHKIEEARQNMPSIIYLRSITSWWGLVDDTAKQVLVSSLESLDTCNNSKVFIFGTATVSDYGDVPFEIKQIFPEKKCLKLRKTDLEEKKNFFRYIIVEKNLQPQKSPEGVRGPLNFKSDQRKILRNKTGRLRNGKTYRQLFSDEDIPSKKIKVEVNSMGDSKKESKPHKKEKSEIIIDVKKLEKLVEAATEVTAKSQVNSLVRLYEELEIISLRYSSKSDRSQLPEELEREISNFRAGC